LLNPFYHKVRRGKIEFGRLTEGRKGGGSITMSKGGG